MTDEREPIHIGSAVDPLIAVGTLGLRQQPDLLVVANRLYLAARRFGDAPNRDLQASLIFHSNRPGNEYEYS